MDGSPTKSSDPKKRGTTTTDSDDERCWSIKLEDKDAKDLAYLLELYPSSAFEIWDRFDHLFVNKLIQETGKLKEEINNPKEKKSGVKKNDATPLKDVVIDPEQLNRLKEKYGIKY